MARVQVQFGGRGGSVFDLETNEDLVAIRTKDTGPVAEAQLSGSSRRMLDQLEPVTRFGDAGVEVFHVRDGSQSTRDAVRGVLADEPAIRFAGRVLADPVFKPDVPVSAVAAAAPVIKEPVLYSENLFVKFTTTVTSAQAKKVLTAAGLTLKRPVEYLEHAYFVEAPEGTGLQVFDIALNLLRDIPSIELCHPELLRPRQFRGAFAEQWHLHRARLGGVPIDAHVSAVEAWTISKGSDITIAVIDTGIDIDHEEFTSSGKIVAPRDVTAGAINPADPRPQSTRLEKHGTACAGVACGDGRKGASGVAPAAKLMPIRLMAGLGSQSEADAFAWAADNGADVISCSWGPTDGHWWDPTHPGHRANIPLPDNTRLAIEYALTSGRAGKGCVICWAAGNGNESADNDGYVSHPGVIAVAACNDSGTRSVYSDTGKAIWCAFPSGDSALEAVDTLPEPPPIGGVWDEDHPAPKTTGIWTTDWSGSKGYNPGGGTEKGDEAGHYTNSFSGTSSATPGVAGVAALILGVNKDLRHEEVREIIKQTCDRVDTANGQYDATTGHSPLYGYGRVNAAKAVALARERGEPSAVPVGVRSARSMTPGSRGAPARQPKAKAGAGAERSRSAGAKRSRSAGAKRSRSASAPRRSRPRASKKR